MPSLKNMPSGGHVLGEKVHNISTQEFWILVVIIFVCINSISIIFSILFFLKVGRDPASANTVQTPRTRTINREQLQQVLEGFNQRKMEFDQRKTAPLSLPDPTV